MEMKIVISDPKTGKSYGKTLSAEEALSLSTKRLGEEIDLSVIGLDGYSASITGGSYQTGTPMRKEIDGIGLKKIMLEKGIGNRQGIRRRKSVAGNTVSQFTSQINLQITKYGQKTLDEIFTAKKENG
ncbi:MAG: 30S ribosomal protein S6e [Candidatus Parvarchaeota archaeon]|jgi:small subunit ribosomal protein S6e|nr:30S ribosomal protein S6e [Candidatus Parvarchaeota archaeon]